MAALQWDGSGQLPHHSWGQRYYDSGCPQRAAKSPKFRYRLSGMPKSSKMEYRKRAKILKDCIDDILRDVRNTIEKVSDCIEKLEWLQEQLEYFKSLKK